MVDSCGCKKNHCAYQAPIGISRWGHPGSLETPLAVLWTAKTVYPDKFGHIYMQGDTIFIWNLYGLAF